MSRHDAVMVAYQKGYDKAKAFYENDQLDEAVEEAESMLANDSMPRYFRIKCYLLVAACLEDRIEADDLIERAESQWVMARSFVPQTGRDTDIEDALAELRGDIDSVKQHFKEERAAAWAQEKREIELEIEREEMGVEVGSEEGEAIQEEEAIKEEEAIEEEEAIKEESGTADVEMKGEEGVPEVVVVEASDQMQVDQQKAQGSMDTGAEPLFHHRHRPGSVRLKKQASRASIRPASGSSPAAVQPVRNLVIVPVINKVPAPSADK